MLQSTTTITKFLGIGFILLSVLRLTPAINIDSKSLLSFAIAALCLILSDLVEYAVERIKDSKNFKPGKTLYAIHSFFLACAAIAVIVMPFLKIDLEPDRIKAWSDAITLCGLGIAITLIGLKTERTQKLLLTNELRKMFEEVRTEAQKFNYTDEGKRITEARLKDSVKEGIKKIPNK